MSSRQAEKVIAFAQEGAPVVLVASERVRAHSEVVDHMRKAGGKAPFMTTDATDVAAVKHLVDTTGGG